MISTEYRVYVEHTLYKVDVAGFKEGESIAVECGRTRYSKMLDLQKVFTVVKRLYYTKTLNPRSDVKKVSRKFPLTTRVYSKDRLYLPREVREKLDVKEGDKIYFVDIGMENSVLIQKAPILKKDVGTYR